MGIETLVIASLASSVVSAGIGFMGAQQQAAGQEAAANYQAQVAKNNQVVAAQNAQYASQAAAIQAQSKDFQNRAKQGGILAAQAASGIDVGSGSSAEVRQSAEQLGKLDTETIYSNALQTVRGDVQQSKNFEAQSQLDTLTARNARSAGTWQSFGSLIGGASSFSDKWARYQLAGVL